MRSEEITQYTQMVPKQKVTSEEQSSLLKQLWNLLNINIDKPTVYNIPSLNIGNVDGGVMNSRQRNTKQNL